MHPNESEQRRLYGVAKIIGGQVAKALADFQAHPAMTSAAATFSPGGGPSVMTVEVRLSGGFGSTKEVIIDGTLQATALAFAACLLYPQTAGIEPSRPVKIGKGAEGTLFVEATIAAPAAAEAAHA